MKILKRVTSNSVAIQRRATNILACPNLHNKITLIKIFIIILFDLMHLRRHHKWPLRFPDLTPLDFLLGCMKGQAYKTPPVMLTGYESNSLNQSLFCSSANNKDDETSTRKSAIKMHGTSRRKEEEETYTCSSSVNSFKEAVS